MAIVKGAFNDLLRPGLEEAFREMYEWSSARTGVYDVQIPPFEPRRGIERKPLSEPEEYPPRDWP
jgi:hypothetical protein